MYIKLSASFAISITLLNLSGCAILARPYKDASGENTAQFTITNPYPSGMFVHTYAEADECKSRYLIGFLRPENSSKTIKIRSDKIFAYRMNVAVAPNAGCAFTIGFKPIKGKHYYASIGYNARKGICENILYEDKNNPHPVTSAFLKSNYGGTRMDENSSWCSKDEVEKYVK